MTEKFLEYLDVERRYSPHTITSYAKDLADFRLFLMESEGHDDLRRADKKIVRNFMAHLSVSGVSRRTINRKLSSLRGFYLFLMKIGDIEITPLEGIQSLKFYPEKQIPFSIEEMQDLKDKLEDMDAPPQLERLLIETLYQTGMRKAELCGLLYKNVDFSQQQIRVIGKGDKERIIPVSQQLCEELQTYATDVRWPREDSEKYFFVNNKGRKIGERFVYSVVNSYLGLVSGKQKKSPHILRHSFATHILESGAEISKVKKILGHASLASTQVYTHANIEQLKKVYNAAHPRAKKDL